jgi:hypothetical protein
VEELGKNLAELEKVIGGKNENVRMVEDGEFRALVVISLPFYLSRLWVGMSFG